MLFNKEYSYFQNTKNEFDIIICIKIIIYKNKIKIFKENKILKNKILIEITIIYK